MAVVKATLDTTNPPRLSDATKARLDRMTDEELTANVLSDPDNPPLTDRELNRLAPPRVAKRARGLIGRALRSNPALLKH
jgi:hypothetical protein